MQTATEKSKAAVLAIATGREIPTPEKSRHIWLAAGALVRAARDAEHAAFLVMRELEFEQHQSAFDLNEALVSHLGDLKNQMVFMGGLIRGN